MAEVQAPQACLERETSAEDPQSSCTCMAVREATSARTELLSQVMKHAMFQLFLKIIQLKYVLRLMNVCGLLFNKVMLPQCLLNSGDYRKCAQTQSELVTRLLSSLVQPSSDESCTHRWLRSILRGTDSPGDTGVLGPADDLALSGGYPL